MEIETGLGHYAEAPSNPAGVHPQGSDSPSLKRLEIADLRRLLPHNGEALVIDAAEIDEEHRKATGHLLVGGPNDQVFRGHFGIMAGHWMLEFANLTCAALALHLLSPSEGSTEKKVVVFLRGADGISYHRTAVPGDQLYCKVAFERQEKRQIFFSATIHNSATNKRVCSIREISGLVA